MLDWTRLTPVVKQAAQKAASSFPAHHDVSDVEQELWVWVMERKGTVMGILSDSEGSTVALDKLLAKEANAYLKKEDAASYGYDEEDQFNFTIDLIRSILEVVFSHEDWQSFATALDAMPRGKTDPSTSGNNLASYADVSRALTELSDDHYNTLVWRYKYRYTFQQIGDESGITKQAAQDRHRAALNSLQQILGKRDLGSLRRGYSGRTEARGNASSQARIERDYEG